ncbi:RNA-binding protein spenito-like, partial [Contarinia nasturtii]|uniref:RNA-binding protein spenito-like n=1 Tax=Contarinia nasturtii TaxID=265458 RepID=UPI0012D47BDB
MSSIWEATERDRITVKIHNMRRSVSRDSPLRSKRRPGSMGRYDDSSDERMSPERLRRRVARTPSPRRPPSPRIRYISPHREEYVRVPREPVYESRSKYEYKRSISPEYKRPYYGAAPVPDHRRVPPDVYDRYGGPPPHVMHHPREFRPPMHHESVYVPRGPPMYYAHRPPYQHYVPRHTVPRHPVAENKKENKFPNYLHHVQPEDDPLATRTLFAGNLEINISEEELRRIFGKYGTLEDIDIKRPPPDSGNAFAFVRFHNLDMAHRAKVELSGQYIGKLQCKIGYAKVKPTTRIWVGGLGSWTSHTQLEREFDRFGVIKKIEYQKGDIQAYILYESIEAAQAAVNEMRGFALGGPDRRLRTDFFDPNPPSTSSFKPKPPSGGAAGADYYYHEPHHYEEGGGYYPPYVSRGGYRGRGRGRGSYRGAYSGHESHRPPPEDEWRRSASEVDYEPRPPRHVVAREPGLERSRSRSPIRRRSPDSDSDSSSRRNGMLTAARTLPEV